MAQSVLQTAAAPTTTLSDEEVVARVLAGDVSLFEILMRRYNQRLFRIARGILADDAEAEDVMQEAYVRAFRELAGFRGEARFSTWLTRIACHEALARVRKRRRLVSISSGEPPDPPDLTPDPEQEVENRELHSVLREAVEALPDPLRSVFCLREIEGLSSEEAADALGITAENVRVRLHRAKLDLRHKLDQRIGREIRRLYLFDGPRCDRLVEDVFLRLIHPRVAENAAVSATLASCRAGRLPTAVRSLGSDIDASTGSAKTGRVGGGTGGGLTPEEGDRCPRRSLLV